MNTQGTVLNFKMHPSLLMTVIKEQAGTVAKALLEGVMNSVDAGATRVDLALDVNGFTLIDNGRGFADKEEIDRVFATFGTPHEEGDATFGRFRIGRGQMMAFARVLWSSNKNQMDVDIQARGLSFIYRELAEPVAGCRIEGKFFEHLTAGDLLATIREVTRFCLWLPGELFINGERANKDVESGKWTATTEEAYVNLVSGGTKGIDIYQQGVFVETIPAHSYGLSGTIVTRVGFPLRVNFARNQVIRSCPRFQRLIGAVKVKSKAAISSAVKLDESQVDSIITRLAAREILITDDEIKNAKIFRDVTGRYWNAAGLRRFLRSTVGLPDGKYAYSVAPLHDQRGDRAMQSKEAFVFEKENFLAMGGNLKQGFDLNSDYQTGTWIRRSGHSTGLDHESAFIPIAKLTEKLATSNGIVPEKMHSPREKRILAAAGTAMWPLTGALSTVLGRCRWSEEGGLRRTIQLGEANDIADGWTDGRSYIAISRKFIEKMSTNLTGFTNLAMLLLHELCHDNASNVSHVHDADFYRAYHDASYQDSAIGRAAQAAYDSYVRSLRKAGKRHSLEVAKEARMQEAVALEQKVFGRSTAHEPEAAIEACARAASE